MSESTITLPESLTIHHIEEQLSDLRVAFQTDADVLHIDASNIETIDTSGLQLLLALIKNALSSNQKIHWQNPSETLTTNAEKLGLTDKLCLA